MTTIRATISDLWQRSDWAQAFAWGFGVALLQRLILLIWMSGVWFAAGPYFAPNPDFQSPDDVLLPPLTGTEAIVFGVWRRWDAIHYLNLASNGYLPVNESLSVFPPLTAFGISAVDSILPGNVDLAGMVFATMAFGLALTLLYRICQVYYKDTALGPWAVVLTALLPLGHFFSAPMSEAPYLAMTLGVVYFAARDRWWAAAMCGILATLTRSQGVLLAGIAGLILIEQHWHSGQSWRERVWLTVRKGYPLLFVPVGLLAFDVFRRVNNFAPISEIYTNISYRFFVNPIQGLYINIRYWLTIGDFWGVDSWGLVISLLLTVVLCVRQRQRRFPMLIYTIAFMIIFLMPINWQYGTDVVTQTQSFARYALTLFPLTIMVADAMRNGERWTRLAGAGILLVLALGLSARHVVGLLGP
ncbi:MAG: mannosyltransferase family protein [Chloroflexota bacterium]|nr:mannosyltransferase family protein [Chloroflexota bacterium]